MNRLETLYSQHKNEFCKQLKLMKGTTKNEDLPPLDKLIQHFKNLYFDENAATKLTEIEEPDMNIVLTNLSNLTMC